MSIIALNYTIPVILVKILQCVPRFDKQFFSNEQIYKITRNSGTNIYSYGIL